MLRIKISLIFVFFASVTACGTYNVFEDLEQENPQNLKQAALLLEEGNPSKAKEVILSQIPQPAQLVLQTESPNVETFEYSQELATSMVGVESGGQILSMYAMAEAQTSNVNALNILVDIAQIDANLKSGATLRLLDQASDDAAIATFGPAMPPRCYEDAIEINQSLDKAIAILIATSILAGFDTADIENKARELRASLLKEDLFNAAIFSQVNVICPVLEFDRDKDKKISAEEATEISDERAEDLYNRINEAINFVQAMVDKTPGNENLDKALSRMKSYLEKIDSLDDSLSTGDKIRGFLVSQSQ
ncbi:MAG: hypothetical protein AB8G05_21790 [Oligoflexales bacterium]